MSCLGTTRQSWPTHWTAKFAGQCSNWMAASPTDWAQELSSGLPATKHTTLASRHRMGTAIPPINLVLNIRRSPRGRGDNGEGTLASGEGAEPIAAVSRGQLHDRGMTPPVIMSALRPLDRASFAWHTVR